MVTRGDGTDQEESASQIGSNTHFVTVQFSYPQKSRKYRLSISLLKSVTGDFSGWPSNIQSMSGASTVGPKFEQGQRLVESSPLLAVKPI